MIPFVRRSLLLAFAASTASIVTAQTVGDGDAVPLTNLNLPSTFTTFGKVEPTLRKATAIVNGEIITGTDIEQRLALIILANGGKVPEEERDRLRVQVLRNLIDEVLQIQEAKANKIEVTYASPRISNARQTRCQLTSERSGHQIARSADR
jgi:peptidyl-prolyl cis-trans isomerase SurA